VTSFSERILAVSVADHESYFDTTLDDD